MKSNVEQLTKLQENLEAARLELESINEEESLLEWEPTAFPQLQQMFQMKDPYDKLWTTAYTFHNKQEQWMNGETMTPGCAILIFRPKERLDILRSRSVLFPACEVL